MRSSLFRLSVSGSLLLAATALAGCGGPSYEVSETTKAPATDINYLISQVKTPSIPKQRTAMLWMRKLKPAEGQAALPALQELLTKTKDPLVKKDVELTIAHIQGS